MTAVTTTRDAAWDDDARALLRQLRPTITDDQLDRLATEGPAQGLRLLVAHLDGRPAGLACHRRLVTSRGTLLFVDDLVTDEALRGHGIGSVLVDALRAIAVDEGCDRIELDSGLSNTGAHAFYARHGLQPIAQHFAGPVER